MATKPKIIKVDMADLKISSAPNILKSSGIGSCIVITIYDVEKRIGGLAHVMLPDSTPEGIAPTTKYAVNAIEQMLNQMAGRGTNVRDLEACLVGAGNVLQKTDDTICDNNIGSITAILSQKNIPIRASALGGIRRKSIFLDIETGIVTYSEGNGSERPLWQPLSRRQNRAAAGKGV